MTNKRFESWLGRLDKAWEGRNAKAAAALFAPNVIYFENPQDPPLVSKNEILKLWQEVPKTQRDIKTRSEILMTNKHSCVAHFKADFYRLTTNSLAHLDGIYFFELNNKNLCTQFCFWSVSREQKIA